MLLTLFFNSIDPIRLFNLSEIIDTSNFNSVSATSVLYATLSNYAKLFTYGNHIFVSSLDNLEEIVYVSYDGLITHDEVFAGKENV